jgi:hypothetical protein
MIAFRKSDPSLGRPRFWRDDVRWCGWRRAIDTGLDSPLDIAEPGDEAAVAFLQYKVQPRSVVVLVGRDGDAL